MTQTIPDLSPDDMCEDTNVTINLNQWIHVAISVNGNDANIYKNNGHVMA